MDNESFLLQLFYCVAGVLLFLVGTGWINFTLFSKIRNRFSPTQRLINDLHKEIQQHRAEQAKLPIMDQFAANRKKQRVIDKLTDDLQNLITKRDQQQMASGFVWSIFGKGLCVSLGLYLASQSADLRVINIGSSYFYPFNFLLSYPNLSSTNPAETSVSLFSFIVLFFIVANEFHRRVIVGNLKGPTRPQSKLN